MQNTTHYNLTKAEGTDTVNLLTQCYPNFDTIDAAMFANKQGSIGTATEVATGTVHAITRANPDSDVFRFTATSAWAAGDTMTLDGSGVTVHLADGTTPASGAYIIGAEVLGVVNGSLVTLFLSSTIQTYVSSFNSRSGAVSPAASDYDASMVDYDNTMSGLNATDVQGAIDEIASGGLDEVWSNPAPNSDFNPSTINFADKGYSTIFIKSTGCPLFAVSIDGVSDSVYTVGASSAVGTVAMRIRDYIALKSGGIVSVDIGACSMFTIGNYGSPATPTTNNSQLKPIKIYAK